MRRNAVWIGLLTVALTGCGDDPDEAGPMFVPEPEDTGLEDEVPGDDDDDDDDDLPEPDSRGKMAWSASFGYDPATRRIVPVEWDGQTLLPSIRIQMGVETWNGDLTALDDYCTITLDLLDLEVAPWTDAGGHWLGIETTTELTGSHDCDDLAHLPMTADPIGFWGRDIRWQLTLEPAMDPVVQTTLENAWGDLDDHWFGGTFATFWAADGSDGFRSDWGYARALEIDEEFVGILDEDGVVSPMPYESVHDGDGLAPAWYQLWRLGLSDTMTFTL